MRMIFALALMPLPSLAWEFSPDPLCTLSHQTEAADIVITYDGAVPRYTLAVTLRGGAWTVGPFFSMSYPSGVGPNISTDRHTTANDARTLIVTDSGFGNVLAGLEDNDTVIMTSGETQIAADLSTADPAIAAFRLCPSDLPPTS